MHPLCDALPMLVVQVRAVTGRCMIGIPIYAPPSWLSNLTPYSMTIVTSVSIALAGTILVIYIQRVRCYGAGGY